MYRLGLLFYNNEGTVKFSCYLSNNQILKKMIQLVFSMVLLAAVSLTSIDTAANAEDVKKTTRILKRLDDGQPLVD